MTVFVCIDDNNGMLFNKRRQSRDSAVIERVVQMSGGKRLLMNSYSSRLFKGYDITVEESFLDIAQEGDCCFVENNTLAEHDSKIGKFVVFKWNRIYPSDKILDITFDNKKLELCYDFEGTSHEKITCEVWVK